MSFKDKLKSVFLEVPADERPALKEAFNEALSDVTETAEPKESKFMEMPLSNGNIINVEPEVVVGAMVTMLDAEGMSAPVEDGEYELEDGRILVVVEGVVNDILEPTGEVVEVSEEEMSNISEAVAKAEPKVVIERTETERKFEEATNKVEELTTKNAELEAAFNEFKEDSNNKLDKVLEAVEVLMDFSSVAPTEKPKTVSALDRIKAMKQGFKKHK